MIIFIIGVGKSRKNRGRVLTDSVSVYVDMLIRSLLLLLRTDDEGTDRRTDRLQ